MGITKRDKIGEWLVFTLLVIFPFGQLVKVGIVSGVDVIAGALLLVYLLRRNQAPKLHKYFKDFFLAALFSLIFSIGIFGRIEAFFGGLYFLRLVAYYAVFVLVWNLPEKVKTIVHRSLFIILVFVAIFGWFQYFFYPDLRALYQWGWDDHLYRLVGTFLDPGFTGILLVFGFLFSLAKLASHPTGGKLNTPVGWALAALFFLISVVFTYSRASYLAFSAGVGTLLFLRKKTSALALVGLVFLVILFFLPKGIGEGQRLERLSSVYTRLINYQETIEIFQKSPLLGVGFNNLCLAKQIYLKKIDTASHSCSGSDSSLLLILTTTGIIGGLIFLNLGYHLVKKIPRDIHGEILLASLAALFVHSAFANSLFYPWVLVYLAILWGIAYRE